MRSHYAYQVGYFWFGATLAGLRDVEPYEVLQVLGGKVRWLLPALPPEGIRVLMMLGRTMDWWIVGAREMSVAELAMFEEREADHD